MSTIISMAIPYTIEEGQPFYDCVDLPGNVWTAWEEARRDGTLIHVRRVFYKALPDEAGSIHSKSPREVERVIDLWLNPDWVEAISPGHYPDASEEWRRQNDGGD